MKANREFGKQFELPARRVLCWPLLLLSAVTMAQGYLEQFPSHQRTKYFEFHYKRNPERIAAIARFADGFVTLLNRDFFKADFDYPIRVLVLEDRAAFQEFLRREFRVNDPPNFGIYLPAHKLFATYEDSGLGTFTHEILHPLVERNLKDRPLWAMEGIPTFFEKFYGYWKEVYGNKVHSTDSCNWFSSRKSKDMIRILKRPWRCRLNASFRFGNAT